MNNFRKCNIHKALLLQPKNWCMQLFSLGRNLYNERMTALTMNLFSSNNYFYSISYSHFLLFSSSTVYLLIVLDK